MAPRAARSLPSHGRSTAGVSRDRVGGRGWGVPYLQEDRAVTSGSLSVDLALAHSSGDSPVIEERAFVALRICDTCIVFSVVATWVPSVGIAPSSTPCDRTSGRLVRSTDASRIEQVGHRVDHACPFEDDTRLRASSEPSWRRPRRQLDEGIPIVLDDTSVCGDGSRALDRKRAIDGTPPTRLHANLAGPVASSRGGPVAGIGISIDPHHLFED